MEITTKQDLRKLAFTQCETQQHLHDWIEYFVGIDFPDVVVDPESNSCPMALIWEVYSKAMEGKDPNFTQVLSYASRDSYKTLAVSILEFAALVHMHRDVAHVAAVMSQSEKAVSYIRNALFRDPFVDFITTDNKRSVDLVWHQHTQTAEILTDKEWRALTPDQQKEYKSHKHYLHVLVATLAGMNSEHVPFFCLDELDVVQNPQAIKEGKLIPTVRDGKFPITVMTSTRKFAFGYVQRTIDDHEKDPDSTLQVRHWNIIDVTEACPPTRHLPDEPKIPIYVEKSTFSALSEEQFLMRDSETQKKFEKKEGYTGCLKNCRIFAACQGNLATRQKGRSPLLRPINHTVNLFKETEDEVAQAQLMCWKPGQTGLVYPRFERKIHAKTATEIAHSIFVDLPEGKEVTKEELIKKAVQEGLPFVAGLDWGFTHNFAVVTAIKYGNILYVVDVIALPGLELAQKLDVCAHIKEWNPTIYPDPEDPASAKSFKRVGYRMVSFTKDVKLGIEAVRWKLSPPLGGAPQLYFLSGDPQVELLMTRVGKYHFTLDQAGEPTEVPDEKDDDECDALRYLVQNNYSKKSVALAPPDDAVRPTPTSATPTPLHPNTWMRDKIAEYLGQAPEDTSQEKTSTKKGGLVWDMS